MRMRRLGLLLVLVSIGMASQSRAISPTGGTTPTLPAGPMSYFMVHAEMASRFPGLDFTGPSGLSVDWGTFQSRYVAGGARFGLTRADPSIGTALFFGGGVQFHVPIGSRLRLVPSFNLGYRIASGGTSMTVLGGLAGVATFGRTFAGLEAETYLYAQGAGSTILPGNVSLLGVAGFSY